MGISEQANSDAFGELYERYLYRDVQLNIGLTDLDFDPANPDYRF